MSNKKYEWIKASDEPLPKLKDYETLSIKWDGKPKVIKFFDGNWYWADDYQNDFAFSKPDMKYVKWLKEVQPSQEPYGYVFRNYFFKNLKELEGQTFDETDKPIPVFVQPSLKEDTWISVEDISKNC